MELSELRSVTNWNTIHMVGGIPVVVFDEADASKIHGLRMSKNGMYLNYDELEKEQISYLVKRGDEVFQYWMIGDKCHRNGKPAYVYANKKSKVCKQRYYYSDMLHNLNGPSEINFTNYDIIDINPFTSEKLPTGVHAEVWDTMHCYWYVNGEETTYPLSESAKATNGCRFIETSMHNSEYTDIDEYPSWFFDKVTVNWNGDEASNSTFRIRYLRVSGYARSFADGHPDKHWCKDIESLTWVSNGELVTSGPKTRESVRMDMFSEWNIWDGPLFKNEMEAMFALQNMT